MLVAETTRKSTIFPQMTGNDIPDDVWRIIVQQVSQCCSITQYMGVNRTFYNYALDQRYHEVRWVVLDKAFVKQLGRLQSPLIAKHVHTLHIRAWFLEYSLKRDTLFNPPSTFGKVKSVIKDSLVAVHSKLGIDPYRRQTRPKPQWMLQHEHLRSKDGPLSFKEITKAMIKAVEGMSNVVELNFEWRDLPLNKDTQTFLTSTRTAFDKSLRKLTLRAQISKFKELLAITNFDNIEELDFHFDYRRYDKLGTPDPDIQEALDTIIPFINQRRSSLRSLVVSSSTSSDLSSFFSALPSDLMSLRRFGVDISFHPDLLSDPNGIIRLLESRAVSLRHVSLSANWEYSHFESAHKSYGVFNDHATVSEETNTHTQKNTPWGRMNDLLLAHSKCLSHLDSLELPFISLGKTIPLVRRSCDTLTQLCLTTRYLTRNEVEEVVGLFSHRSLEFEHLQLAVASLDFPVLLTLATRLPDLFSLVLVFEKFSEELERVGKDPTLGDWKLYSLEVYDKRYRLLDYTARIYPYSSSLLHSERVAWYCILSLVPTLRQGLCQR